MGKSQQKHPGIVLFGLLFGVIGLMVAIGYLVIRTITSDPFWDDRRERKALLAEFQEYAARVDDQRAVARTQIPADAPIRPDWDCVVAVKQWNAPGYEALSVLVSGFLDAGGKLNEETLAEVKEHLGLPRQTKALSELERGIDPAQHTSKEIRATLRTFLISSEELRDFEAGLRFGLCRYGPYSISGGPWAYELHTLVELLAARGFLEVESSQLDAALDTCKSNYQALAMMPRVGAPYSYGSLLWATRDASEVIWRLCDIPNVPDSTMQELMALAKSHPDLSLLKQTIRFVPLTYGPGVPSYSVQSPLIAWMLKENWEHELILVDELSSFVEIPPYRVRAQIVSILNRVPEEAAITDRSLDAAVTAYRIHWRLSISGDVARAVLALKGHKKLHGAYPEMLDAVAESIIDPVTGEPLDYARVDDGFEIWATPLAGQKHRDVIWRALR